MTNEKVLVVDDEPINVKIIASCLENEGYKVFKAHDGIDALRIARESKPDLIILDVMMPGLDGFEVTKQLRQNPETNIIPIILLTALGATKDKVKGLNAGADDFLTKPTNFFELRARVRSLLKLKQLHEKAFSISSSAAHLGAHGDEALKEKNIILIIEDDVIEAKKSSVILAKAGYDTITADTAQEAEEILNNTLPDLILLDIMLPDRSGIELLATLRGKREIENLPIIIVSSIDDLKTKVKGIDTGADDYIVKPVNSLELIARVKSNIHKYEVQQRLIRNAEKLLLQSMTDPLTGLYNREYLQTVVVREMADTKRYGSIFSMLLFDIDNFKCINDTCGHVSGDNVLRELGRITKDSIRINDVAARYGGDEFVVMLPNTTLNAAAAVAEKLRLAVEFFKFANVADRVISISIGVIEGLASEEGLDSLINRADKVLYFAKGKGRNRVEVQSIL